MSLDKATTAEQLNLEMAKKDTFDFHWCKFSADSHKSTLTSRASAHSLRQHTANSAQGFVYFAPDLVSKRHRVTADVVLICTPRAIQTPGNGPLEAKEVLKKVQFPLLRTWCQSPNLGTLVGCLTTPSLATREIDN